MPDVRVFLLSVAVASLAFLSLAILLLSLGLLPPLAGSTKNEITREQVGIVRTANGYGERLSSSLCDRQDDHQSASIMCGCGCRMGILCRIRVSEYISRRWNATRWNDQFPVSDAMASAP